MACMRVARALSPASFAHQNQVKYIKIVAAASTRAAPSGSFSNRSQSQAGPVRNWTNDREPARANNRRPTTKKNGRDFHLGHSRLVPSPKYFATLEAPQALKPNF